MKSKKNVGRILSIALLLVFALATFGVEAAATETEVTPRYTGVSTLAASLDISKLLWICKSTYWLYCGLKG